MKLGMKIICFLTLLAALTLVLMVIWLTTQNDTTWQELTYEEYQEEDKEEAWSLVNNVLEISNNEGSILMADVILLDDGSYRMYYAIRSQDESSIRFANSEDGINWEDGEVIIQGSADATAQDFTLGGPSVIKLNDGRYRMYYSATPKQEDDHEHPNSVILSAVSEDGIHFDVEDGIRMDTNKNDSDAEIQFAGHGQFFINNDDLFVAVISANKLDDDGPSDLMLFISEDGLDWEYEKTLFADWHDPVIVYHNGVYKMYATYLKEWQGIAMSTDGLSWSIEMSSVKIQNQEGITLIDNELGGGDIGAVVTKEDDILLYTNFGKPSSSIAVFQKD